MNKALRRSTRFERSNHRARVASGFGPSISSTKERWNGCLASTERYRSGSREVARPWPGPNLGGLGWRLRTLRNGDAFGPERDLGGTAELAVGDAGNELQGRHEPPNFVERDRLREPDFQEGPSAILYVPSHACYPGASTQAGEDQSVITPRSLRPAYVARPRLSTAA